MADIEGTKLALHKRKGFWVYVRRVPLVYAPHDGRGLVILSTGIRITDDPKGIRAKPEVVRLNACTERYWRERAAGLDVEAFDRYALSVRQTTAFGFEPVDVKELLERDDEDDFADRVNAVIAVSAAKKEPDVKMLEALMGVEPAPGINVSLLLDEYERIGAAALASKSVAQLKKWRAVRLAALSRFIEAIGVDRAIGVLKRVDTVKFREHMQALIEAQKVTIATANKTMKIVGAMYRAVDEHYQLDLKPVFDKLLIRGGKDGKRLAYDPAFVQSHILAEGVFDDINSEARGLIYLLIETGLRLSEACNLNENTIILDAAVPHVIVEPDGRELKTEQSRREIPLVGVALMAMRLNPKGFPRYREKADSFSAFANKMFKARGLRPLEGQSIYSLRHTFKDRLRNAGANEELMDMLMGHTLEKGKDYGKGYFFPIKAELLNRIAFKPPSKI